jgi:hypothetical protein
MTVVYASAIALMGIGDIAASCSPNVWVAIWFVLLAEPERPRSSATRCSSSAGYDACAVAFSRC